MTTHYAKHLKLQPLIFGTTFTDERAIAVYEPAFTALLAGGFRPDQLRLVIALIEFQAMGLAQGLPEPVTDDIRATLPGYAASIEHSGYDREAATDFSVEAFVRGLASILDEGEARS